MKENVFRKKNLEKIASPEQLDDYIRVTRPSVWFFLSGIIILLATVIFWGFTSTLTTSIDAKGIADNGMIVGYFTPEDVQKFSVGMEVVSGEFKGVVLNVGTDPISKAAIFDVIEDEYLASSLDVKEWNIPVTILIDGVANGLVPISVVLDEIRPVDFIMN